MRAIRLTKAEADLLRRILDPTKFDWSCYGTGAVKAAASLLAKLGEAEKLTPPGANIGPIEAALVASSRGKVIPLVTGHAVASRRAGAAGCTPEDARLVGAWMAGQGWLRGPQTLLDVLNKWPQWLSKARAFMPPDPLKPGLGEKDAAGRGAAEPSPAPQGRLRKGFAG